MTTVADEIVTYKCPNCGSDAVFMSVNLDLIAAPEWMGTCCAPACRTKLPLSSFLVTSKRTVSYSTTITSNYIN